MSTAQVAIQPEELIGVDTWLSFVWLWIGEAERWALLRLGGFAHNERMLVWSDLPAPCREVMRAMLLDLALTHQGALLRVGNEKAARQGLNR